MGNPTNNNDPGCTLKDLPTVLEMAKVVSTSSSTTVKTQITNLPKFSDVYEKDQRLRSGSYGTVYTCQHKKSTDVTYAVKIMDRAKLKSKDVESIVREINILHELTQTRQNDEPNYFVDLIDFFLDRDNMYMVQVYAAGGDVFDRLTSRRVYTERDARGLAQNLLQAIKYLHTRKPYRIIHRDLKPENLLLLDIICDTQVLVADFGFARHVKDDEKCNTRCGSPAYVSPEIILGLPYTVSSDLWSIGCILYMLVAGYAPFQAPHHRALFRKIRAADFVFHEQYWKNVSVEAKQLIAHLLTVNPNKRWTADEALQCDWFKKADAEKLAQHDLSGSLQELKKFEPKNAWKKAFVALGFCATAKFWEPDAISFTQQMSAWDEQASSNDSTATTGSIITSATLMNKLPKIRFDDRYELLKQIRKGSYATVWECKHKETSTIYAAKIIQREGLKPRDDEAVLNEVAVMQALAGNKYVVELLDFYEEDDKFYLVMENCTGGDVFDKIVELTQYTERNARELALTLLKAVKSVHKAGFAHRDIKPQNLLLLNKSDVTDIRLADFGFARRVHTPESLTTRVGTPTYVAPEILKNLPHDERVDLWSVGVVIFVLLVGYPPFLDEDQNNLFHKIRNGDWKFYDADWKHISQDAKELIKGLLVVDPGERWTISECLRSKWINQDANQLSSIDLSESLRALREKKSRLRSIARAFMGLGDMLKPVDVATQAQEGSPVPSAATTPQPSLPTIT